MQMQAKSGKADKVADGDIKTNGGYTFRAYEQLNPKLTFKDQPKETKFSMDNDKVKQKKVGTYTPQTGKINASGISAEYGTRRQGSVMPLGGIGESFGKFRKAIKNESYNDPGDNEMGTINNATNKDKLETIQDKTGQDIKTKKKVGK